MEEFQEADVLWPEQTPPPSRDQEHYLPAAELHEATTGRLLVGIAQRPDQPASSSSTSGALCFDRSDGFLSDPSSTATGHDDVAEEFQEVDVLWPDDDTAGEIEREDGGEFWWLCCGFGEAGRRLESAAAGKREVWRPLVSSPIDIPTRVAAARCHPTTAVLVHRR